jgi:hypothetical protein
LYCSLFFFRYELSKVEVERGKYLLAEDELIKKEHQLATEKTDMAMDRLKKEEWKVRKAIHHRRTKERFVCLFDGV